MHFNHILLTTDFSPGALSAFEFVAYEKKMSGTKLSLVHVLDETSLVMGIVAAGQDAGQIPNILARQEKTVRIELEELAKKHLHGIAADTHVLTTKAHDAPSDLVVKFAKDNQCDLIIMSSHGRGTIGTFFIGSTVQQVLRQAPCPVLIVPSRKEGNKRTGD